MVFLMLACTSLLHGQMGKDQAAGSWLGILDAGPMSLRLIFNLSLEGDTGLVATLDSPDQGARGLILGEVSLEGDSLKIEAPMLRGSYQGKFNSFRHIEGTWYQAGRSFDLPLDRQDSAFVLNRPQEPHPPFPYREEEVSFRQIFEGFTLAGTLTLPEGDGPFPAAVLVTGSGPQNRNEEIFGHKPFLVLADHLTRKGIAVLRYDDRGVAASGGMASGSTTADHSMDARSAVEYLLSRGDMDSSMIGIIGHSEGGLIAFMLASEYKDISFIVSLAGPGVDGKTILLEQSEYISRLSGLAESIVQDNRKVMGKVYDLMVVNETHQSWAEEVTKFISTYYLSIGDERLSEEDIEQIKNNVLNSIPGTSYAWMRYFVMSDPSVYFPTIACPVLALNGGKDCQVLAEKNINAIKEGFESAGNKHLTTMILPGLNHLFQNCKTGLPSEYNLIEETFDPRALELISGWILQLQ
jgi:pimeloyl-ACP methyl ester carboxylesterase